MKTASIVRAVAALSGLTCALDVNSISDAFSWPSNSGVNAASPNGALLSDGKVQLGTEAAAAYEKAKAFVAKMTTEEKIKMITGQSFTGNVTWKGLMGKDGSSGINGQFFVSGFLMSEALTMTWNRDLIAAQNKALGDEFYGMGFNLINGPVASPLGRNPYGGRANEAFSPDPYLTGIALGKAISAMNSAGVISSGRHFLLNEQETNRNNGGYSSNANDKTLHEVYLWPFADAVNSGMMGAMCGMNRVNGTRSCETSSLINGALKTELGFPGMVFPDVGSQATSYTSANAGLDQGSGGLWSRAVMLEGLARGNITQARLTDMAERSMMGYFYVGLDDGKQPPMASSTEYRDVVANHSDLIRQTGGEAIILLKNNNANGGGLPLKKPRTVALFGAHAAHPMAGPNQPFSVVGTPSDIYQGHLTMGCGSGAISLPYLITPIQALTARAAADKGMIWWITNNTYTATFGSGIPGGGGGGPAIESNDTTVHPGPGGPGGGGGGGGPGGPGGGGPGGGTSITPSIPNYASMAGVCLVFLNSASGEGGDRHELSDATQDAEVIEVASKCNNTIVVLNISGPRVLDAWIENENVTAVIYSSLLGQESGNAIADVLHGDVNPSGKLTHTIAKQASDYPVSICETKECNFTEGVYVDYRYFDAKNIAVRFPFGYGLSYTTFAYGNVTTKVMNSSALASKAPTGPMALGGPSDLFEEVITATTTIKNTGAITGAEVAQLYLSFPKEAAQPVRVLRGFEKVSIPAGESASVTFSVRRRDISYWSVAAQQWLIASGEYTFSVGSSSRDIKATTTLTI